MTAPDTTGTRFGVDDVATVFGGSGGPLVKLSLVVLGADDVVELDFVAVRLDPMSARELVVDDVRRRASMDPRFARWVVQSPAPTDN